MIYGDWCGGYYSAYANGVKVLILDFILVVLAELYVWHRWFHW